MLSHQRVSYTHGPVCGLAGRASPHKKQPWELSPEGFIICPGVGVGVQTSGSELPGGKGPFTRACRSRCS